ncbi:keratinocyte differentiation factor 1 [Engraulis encrasicolus]|uniref:keratinocyte differentiation factor 1 n=1 Tax=Engraulis encrasicolus TaxID=184585 RepID=UPI002FD619D0
MPGQSMGPNHKSQAQPQSQPHHHASSSSRARADDFRHGRSYSRDSANSQDSGRGDHQHPNNNNHTYSSNHHNHNHTHNHTHSHNHHHNHHHRSHSESRNNKSHSRHTNGRGSETLGFIPGSADAAQGSGAPAACGSCASIGWSGCKALICCILTCGFYGTREPCLPVQNESSTDNPAAKETASVPNNNGKSVEFLESSIGAPARYQVSGVGMGMGMGNGVGMAVSNPTCGIPLEPRKQPELPNSDSFRYKDVHIGGKKVVYHPGPTNANAHNTRRPYASGKTAGGVGGGSSKERPVSIYSREDLDLDDIDDGSGTDIDSLITKKLLELYKLHQIEQLAKCTSDSSFSRKTNEISDLIYSIAQDYNLEEQEAECRLVHGVIRISTRKGRNHKTSYAGRINKEKEYYNNKDYNNHKDYSSQDALLLQHNGRRDGTLPDSGHETMTLTSSFEPEVKVSELTRSDELARKMRLHSGRTYSSSSATVYSPTSNDTDFSGEPLLHFR